MSFTGRFLMLACAGLLLFPLEALGWGHQLLPLGWVGALLVFAIADALLLPSGSAFEVERRFTPEMALGASNSVALHIRHRGRMPVRLRVLDEPPDAAEHDFIPTDLDLQRGEQASLEYAVVPKRRGEHRFGDVWLRATGPLGLAHRSLRYERGAVVKVYPGLAESARFTLAARKGRLRDVGIRALRLAGAGREFESLRDYVRDDDFRRIDWKASARRGKLTSRQYETERSQNVLLLMDFGRNMHAEIDGAEKSDHAIGAALLLSYVATLSDDKVGLLAFADDVQAWIPPAKGRHQVYRIQEALYDARSRRVEPDYRSAIAYLNAHWRRRSLIVCFNDLWDPDSSRETIRELAALQPRHLLACVTLLDSKVIRMAERTVETAEQAFQQAVAEQVLHDRERALAELRGRGALVVDTRSEELSAQLVNRYLEVKARQLL